MDFGCPGHLEHIEGSERVPFFAFSGIPAVVRRGIHAKTEESPNRVYENGGGYTRKQGNRRTACTETAGDTRENGKTAKPRVRKQRGIHAKTGKPPSRVYGNTAGYTRK